MVSNNIWLRRTADGNITGATKGKHNAVVVWGRKGGLKLLAGWRAGWVKGKGAWGCCARAEMCLAAASQGAGEKRRQGGNCVK